MTQDEIGRYIELKRKIHRGEALSLREQIDYRSLEIRHQEMLSKRSRSCGHQDG